MKSSDMLKCILAAMLVFSVLILPASASDSKDTSSAYGKITSADISKYSNDPRMMKCSSSELCNVKFRNSQIAQMKLIDAGLAPESSLTEIQSKLKTAYKPGSSKTASKKTTEAANVKPTTKKPSLKESVQLEKDDESQAESGESEYDKLISAVKKDDTEENPYVSGSYTSKQYAKDFRATMEGKGYICHIIKAYIEVDGEMGVRYFNLVELEDQNVALDCCKGLDKIVSKCTVGEELTMKTLDGSESATMGEVTKIKYFE